MLVAIDPGHGGTDPGAVAGGVQEAAAALEYAQELARTLARSGVAVILTRETHRYLSLGQRCRIANDVRAAAFVSLHCNASANEAAEGVQVYHCAGSARGLALARAVFDRIADVEPQKSKWAGVLPDGSVHTGYTSEAAAYAATLPDTLSWAERDARVRERFGDRAYRTVYVLRGTRMPAILVELGFVTNACDRGRLIDPERRERIARAIAAGLLEWHERESEP